MANKEEYLTRLWSLHDPARSRAQVISPADLLKFLREDFDKRELFSAEEYRDSALREVILDEINRPDHGLYSFPADIARFVHQFLGPGPVLSLFSGFGDVLLEFGSGTGVEPNESVAEWAKLFIRMSGKDIQIVNGNPIRWETHAKFDRIVCNPPFGSRPGEENLFGKLFSLLSDGGQIALIVPVGLLWRHDREYLRKLIADNTAISAVISLPSNTFLKTSIQTAVVVLRNTTTRGKTYLASSRSLADLPAIAADFECWLTGRQFSLGFEADLIPTRWDVGFYEPIDFGLGDIKFPYKVVKLGGIAHIAAGKVSQETKIAVNRTGSKAVWVADEPTLIVRNNIFLTLSEQVNPSYLFLYLNSAVGRRAIEPFIKGESVPHISAADLAHVSVVLPDLATQSQISQEALDLERTVTALGTLADEGKQALREKIFALDGIRSKFQQFAPTTEKAFYQTLPFPIAVVYRKIANATNNTQRFSLLIELFEVAVRFIALVNLADYINNRRQARVVAEQIPAVAKLYGPALGDWVSMFRSFAHLKSATESKPFIEELKTFKLERYLQTLEEFVQIRNASLRGHGATLTEDEYELRFQEHAPKVYQLISSLGFLTNYRLVRTGAMDKEGDFYKIPVQILMGDNPHFEQSSIVLRTPLDTNRVLYLNRNQESLVLDPYIVLERCPECKRPEVLLLDKVSENKVTYLGYESGHRPALSNSDRLPAVIREVASRHTSRSASSSK